MRVMVTVISRSVHAVLSLSAAVAALTALAGHALSQTYDCDRLRSQIETIRAGNSKAAAQYAAAAQKQRADIERTSAYAHSIGCDNRQFLIFGSPPPPQCGGIEAQISRMRAQFQALQARAQAADGGANREALQTRYDTACRGRGGPFDALFGERQQVPIGDFSDADRMPFESLDPDKPRNGSLAVCVRTCDGGYFPVSYSARPSRYFELGELCRAQCPGAEAALYTMPASGDIDQAVSTDGEPYSDLPNADKFRKNFNAKCSCKPANKSWVDALAQAEAMLDSRPNTDIFVTAEKADELSRPRTQSLSPDKIRALLRGAALPDGKDKGRKSADHGPAAAPTASAPDRIESPDPIAKAPTGMDGRTIRIVGPKL